MCGPRTDRALKLAAYVARRQGAPAADVSLLRDVADALKHHRPDRPSATVLASTDIATVSTGFGPIRFGEGKFGGVEQVVVTTKNGDKRALSSVLQNWPNRNWHAGVGARGPCIQIGNKPHGEWAKYLCRIDLDQGTYREPYLGL